MSLLGALSRRQALLGLLAGVAWGFAPRARADTVVTPNSPPTSLDQLEEWAKAAERPKRRALLIGNANYCHAPPLPTPLEDLRLMKAALVDALKFDQVEVVADLPNRQAMDAALGAFKSGLSQGDLAVVYYSGHGVERSGDNFLVPTAARSAGPLIAPFEYFPLKVVLDGLQEASPGFILVILDACRADPFEDQATPPEALSQDDPEIGLEAACAPPPAEVCAGGDGIPAGAAISTTLASPARPRAPARREGLAPLSTAKVFPNAILVAYAASPGKAAQTLRPQDCPTDGSLYTRCLAGRLGEGETVLWALDSAKTDLAALVGDLQQPWDMRTIGSEVTLGAPDPVRQAIEDRTWIRTVSKLQGWRPGAPMSREAFEVAQLRDYLCHFPIGTYSQAARRRIQADNGTMAYAVQDTPADRTPTDRILTGVLASSSAISSPSQATIAMANKQVPLFAKGGLGALLGNTQLDMIEPGEELHVLSRTALGNWTKVETSRGLVGFVADVEHRPLSDRRATQLTFGGEVIELDTDPAALQAFAASASQRSSQVVIRVGLAGGADKGRAGLLSYARALALDERLRTLGVAAYRITTITGEAAQVGVDQAQLVDLGP